VIRFVWAAVLCAVWVVPVEGATWVDVLTRMKQQAVAEGETLWVEKYGTNSMRIWKRAAGPETGVQRRDSIMKLGQSGGGFHSGVSTCKGDGTVTDRSCGEYPCYYREWPPVPVVEAEYGCGGELIQEVTGGTYGYYQAGVNSYCTVNKQIIGTPDRCRTNDALVEDMGAVTPGACTVGYYFSTVVTKSMKDADGSMQLSSVGCVPDGYVVAGEVEDGGETRYILRAVVGDPAGVVGDTGPPGDMNRPTTGSVPGSGDIFDQTKGAGGSGSQSQGGGTALPAGTPLGRGVTSWPSGGSPPGGGGGGGIPTPGTAPWNTPVVGEGGTGGATVGELAYGTKQGVKEALKEHEEEAAAGTNVPGFEGFQPLQASEHDEEAIPRRDITARLLGWMANNPFASAAGASSVGASGSCSFSGAAFGRTIEFNFCPYSDGLSAAGTVLLGFTGLLCLLMLMGVAYV
jgi:hypothetical protein